MAYGPGWYLYRSKVWKQHLKVARRWRAARRTLGYACGSYRRPYTRPAIDDEQRARQLKISTRKKARNVAASKVADLVAARTGVGVHNSLVTDVPARR